MREVIDFFRGSAGSSYSGYVLVLIGLTVLLIFCFVFALTIKRFRRKRSSGLESAMSFGDLDKMGKKGLLTDEELRKVRQAMARRYTEQQGAGKATLADLEGEAARALAAAEEKRKAASGGATSTEGVEEPAGPRIEVETLLDRASDAPEPAAPDKKPSLADLARQGKVSKKEFEALKAVFEEDEDSI